MGRKARWKVTLLIGLVALSACSGDGGADQTTAETVAAETTSPVTEPEELVVLRFGELVVAATVPDHLARELGFLEEEGIVLEAVELEGGAAIVPAMVAGELEVGHVNFASLVFAVTGGADIQCLTSSDSAPESEPDVAAILVASDSDIQSLADLVGRDVAVNNVNSIGWLLSVMLLEEAGVDASGVNFVELPFPNMNDALVAGQVDAIVQGEPSLTALLSAGEARVLEWRNVPVIPGEDIGCIAATRQWINENPDLAAAVARSIDRAKQYATDNPDETRDAIVEFTGLDPALAADMALPLWRQGVSVDSLQLIADNMTRLGMIDSEFDAAAAIWEQ